MPTVQNGAEAEAVAWDLLKVVAAYQGYMGRTKAVRVLRGLDEPTYDQVDKPKRYAGAEGWNVRDTAAMVDAMIDGGLIATTPGARPTLVLTLAGFRSLEALNHANGGEGK